MEHFTPTAEAKAKGDFADSNVKPQQRLVALVDILGSLKTDSNNGVHSFWLWASAFLILNNVN